jgi:hypothetical protein
MNALIELDAMTAPSGLYGIQSRFATSGRLPTLAEIFCSQNKSNLFRRAGFGLKGTHFDQQGSTALGVRSGRVMLSLDNRLCADLQVVDFASTKVRCFGSEYHLDKLTESASQHLNIDLEKAVSRLKNGDPSAILLVAHVRKHKEYKTLVRRCVDPVFLSKHQVMLCEEVHADIHKRDFVTGLFIWYHDPDGPKAST